MSFVDSTNAVTHLVTYPSVWLPPDNAVRIMVLPSPGTLSNKLISLCHSCCGHTSVAVYTFDQWLGDDQEQLDWLLINSGHCQHIWCEAYDAGSLGLALCLRAHASWDPQDWQVAKLANHANLCNISLEEFLSTVVADKQPEASQ